MPLTIRPYRRLPLCFPVTHHAGVSQGEGTIWNVSRNGWPFSGNLPLRVGQPVPMTVTLPYEQRIQIPEAIVRWSRGQEFAVENLAVKPHTRACLQTLRGTSRWKLFYE